MTRLANVERAGYFPLPLSVTNLVCTHIATPKNGRILDPCAGEGITLVTLAEKLGLEPARPIYNTQLTISPNT